jgi:DNA-binding NarL/FixJ family response regulator
MIKVMLYDDNPDLRESINLLLEEDTDIEVVAVLESALSIMEDIDKYKPQVILMDIDMPAINGVEAVKLLRATTDDLPILMLTVFDDNESIFEAICAGANGYILKKNVTTELSNAIKSVVVGGVPMSSSIARKVLLLLSKRSQTGNFNLSSQEQNVLQLLADGYSYKLIASALFISIDTVRFHIKKIYEKLHVHSATEAVSIAIKNNLVKH